MKRTLEELLNAARDLIGVENTSDNAIAFIEDLTDSLSTPEGDGEDWKKKYEENEENWRRRYLDRFYGKKDSELDGYLPKSLDEERLAKDDDTMEKREEEIFEFLEKEGVK